MTGIAATLNDELIRNALNQLERAATNPRAAMDAIGAHFVFSTQRNIELERAPDGTPWPRLSPRTAAKRVGNGRRGYDHMLRVTTRLFRSIAYEATDTSVEWGTNVVYGRIHQLGGTIDMPARSGSVSLKRTRRPGGGIRSRFTRAGAQGSTSQPVSIRGHQIRIPARPYLGISSADAIEVPLIVADAIRREAGV